jgi:hypothetical protein
MLTVSIWNQITTEFFGNVAAARRMAFNSQRAPQATDQSFVIQADSIDQKR